MKVGSFEGRLVHRVSTIGHALKLKKPDIIAGWERARKVASVISPKEVLDVKVSLNQLRLFPDISSYGGCFDALTRQIVTRTKSVHNTLNRASQHTLIKTHTDVDLDAAGLFTFIPILRKEKLNCPVKSATDEFKPDEQAVSTWDYLLFLLSDPARQKICTFVATEDLLTENYPGEYQFSPAVVHSDKKIRIIRVPRDNISYGTILHQLVRTKRTY